MEDSKTDSLPSLKDLASSDPKLRRNAAQTLLSHITSTSRRASLTHTQCLQCWRGLFVALLMHDSKNQLSVQNLIVSLCEPFASLSQQHQSEGRRDGELQTFTAAFWETISREWGAVDALRMDKVLLLVRTAVRRIFESCLSESGAGTGEAELTKMQVGVFEAWPLSPRERKVPDGLRYHALDIWVDELERCKQEDADVADKGEGSGEAVKMLMEPVEKMAKDGLNKTVRLRAKDTLSDARERLELDAGG